VICYTAAVSVGFPQPTCRLLYYALYLPIVSSDSVQIIWIQIPEFSMALVSQGFVSLSSNSHHQEVCHQGLKNDSSGTGGPL